MAIALIFWTFLFSACLLIFWYGQLTEKGFVAFLVVCAGATLAFSPKLGVLELRYAVFAIDLAILAATLFIMNRSSSYWPVWFAGFQAIIVATGMARLIFHDAVTGIYINAAAFWALPEMLVLVLGTLADHRMRIAAPTSV